MVCEGLEIPDKKCRICGKVCGCYIHYRGKFRPKKEPRYIKYMTDFIKWNQDLMQYNEHRKRVYNAKCWVDSNPPQMVLSFYLNRRRLRSDAERLFEMDRENKKMIKAIVEIDRKGGAVDSFNPYAFMNLSRWKKYKFKMGEIDHENLLVHRKICDARSYYPKKEHEAFWAYNYKALKLNAKFPLNIHKKVNMDDVVKSQPSISGSMIKLAFMRPEVFLEFQVEDGECLGRVVVELYLDHVPVTVQNFLALILGCGDLAYKNCPVHRIVKDRFLETGDITKGTGTGGCSIYGETFDEEHHKLKHTKAGVLSMSRLGGEQKNNSKFCITFMNMQEWDKKNVVFGKIIYGIKVLTKLSQYGRTIGKPLKNIYISNCGTLPDCNCEEKHSNIECS